MSFRPLDEAHPGESTVPGRPVFAKPPPGCRYPQDHMIVATPGPGTFAHIRASGFADRVQLMAVHDVAQPVYPDRPAPWPLATGLAARLQLLTSFTLVVQIIRSGLKTG